MKQTSTCLVLAFALAWCWMPTAIFAANPDDCTDPVINTVTSDLNDVCPNTTVELTVDGVLNDATDWHWYTVDCGDTPAGTGTTLAVMPTATTTYYVRGEPGCNGDLPCSSITIIVLDPDAPTLTIPADVTVDCGETIDPPVANCTPIAVLHGEVVLNLSETGSALIDADVFDLASVDACGAGPLSFSFSPIPTDNQETFDCSDLGTQSITIWVTDAQNNQITADVTLTVQDVIDDCNIGGGCHPMPLLLEHLVVSLDESGSATVSASTFDLASEDVCMEGGLSFSFSSDVADVDSTFSCADIGTDTLEVWVTDLAGNQVYANVHITVQDLFDVCNGTVVTCAPVAIFEEGIVATIPADRQFSLAANLFNQGSQNNCPGGSLSFEYSGGLSGASHTFTCNELGVQTLTIQIDDGLGNTNTAAVNLNVQDLDANCQGVGFAMASDNCDSNPTISYVDATSPGACGGESTITRTWTATDAAGNSTSLDQIITIQDTTAPIIVCPVDQSGSFDENCEFEVPDYTGLITAGDACDLLPTITQVPSPGTFIQSTSTITITATDACGNAADCTFTLNLSDDTAPDVTCLGDQIGVIDADCAFEVPDYAAQITVDDNCDPNPQFTQSPAPGMMITQATTVMITVSDGSGNINSSCSFEITLPSAAPVLSEYPADKQVECASQVPDAGGIFATDDCDEFVQVIFTQAGFPLDCVGNGTVVNTWTATDSDGNTTTHSQTITILDETTPVLSATPGDITISCLSDMPVDPEITATDNCEAVISVVYLQSPLPDCAGSGTITRTWVAQDCNGNSAIHAQTITIEDVEEPGFSQYPGSLTVECLADVPGDPGITATDLCEGDIDVVFEQSTLPACNGEGEVLNTWTATDCAGNVSVHTQTITISDQTPPVLSVKPSDITVECGGDVPGDQGVTATDNCDIDVEVTFSQTALPACDEVGAVMNTWTASDCKGNVTTHTQIVTIEDTTGPVFSEEPEDVTVECVDEVPDPMALTATDNCDGDVEVTFAQVGFPPSCVGSGTIEYTWTATDCAGNTATYTQYVTVADTTAPTLSNVPADITVACSADVPGDPGLTVSDDCDGSVAVVFEQSAAPGCLGAGTVLNTWTATDCAGNSTVYVQTVTVEDTTPPVLSLEPVDMTVACVDDVPGDPGIVAEDACSGPVDVTYEQTGMPLACIGDGTVVNTWTATDCAGNSTVYTQTIIVEDLTAPVLSLKPTDVTVACEDDIPADPGVTAFDACEGDITVSFTQSGLPVTYPNPEPVFNTWTATDCAGNISTHTQEVTLEDNFFPIALCKDISINLNSGGNATITADMLDDGSWDNCGTVTLSISQSFFTCTDVGVRPVTLTVSDLFDNQTVCISNVSIVASSTCILPALANTGGPTIADPCTCRSNGEFDEEVVVSITGAGQQWSVASTNLLNPLSLLPYNAGTLLNEIPAGPGLSTYSLPGVHLDGEGYVIVVESPFYPGQSLMISNTCYYPQPEIIGLDGPFCLLSNAVPLEGAAGGVQLLSEEFTINGDPATAFDPSALGVGLHMVEYTVDAGTATSEDPTDPGCVATAVEMVEVVATPAGLACNNNLSVSIDANCEVFITPDMILEGDYLCYDDYGVTVFDGINQIPNPVSGEDYAGETLTVTITHLISGNSCWGSITIQDLLPPTIDCPSTPVQIYCTEDYQQVPPPPAVENCSPISYQLIDEVVTDDDACDDDIVRVERTWIALDDEGNESNPCIQIVEILRPDDIDFPNDIFWSCEQYELYPDITLPEALHPDVAALQIGTQPIHAEGLTATGVLTNTGSGIPLDIDGLYCNYNYSHADQLIASCGTTFKILRTWTVLDWCTNTVVTLNDEGEDNVQLITIIDDVAPVMTLAPFTVSANIPGVHPQPCTSQDFLEAPAVVDNCNNFSIRIFTPVGEAEYVNGVDGELGGFIPSPGLPIGFHTIVYQAEDDCGNVSELPLIIEVIDDITPVAICDEITEVSLSSNGQAVISAAIFDDGSQDNCCIDHFEARRMQDNCGIASNDVFSPNVIFCCEDVTGTPHLVQIRVYDCFDNFNECMVQVFVEDKLPPSLVFCPNDDVITCDEYLDNFAAPLASEDYSVLDVFGAPIFFDNCGVVVTDEVTVTVNNCAEGMIERVWTANDVAGNTPATCTQIIDIDHVSDWTVTFPEDITSTCIDGEIPEFGEPEIFFDGCEMIGTSFDDMYFYIVPDACFKIIRTWTVVNWCIYEDYGFNAYAEYSEVDVSQDFDGDGDFDERTFRDGINNGPEADGYIVYNQVMKVIDEDAPVFDVSDVSVCIVENTCDTHVELPTPDVEDCSDEVTITVSSNLPNPAGNNVYLDVPPGSYSATYEVSDNCGNISYDFISIEVEDCKLPTPYCKLGLIVEIMQTGMVPVPASLIDDNSFDNCSGDLQFSFSSDVNDIERIYDCDQLGQNTVELWVTDASGNQDFCETFIVIQDNMGHCDPDPIIAGLIMTELDAPVENVNVEINSGLFNYVTDQNGMYFTDILTPYNDYSVAPELNIEPTNGVTTLDMVIIQFHILGLNPLDSPYKMIAADINNSGTITTLDLVFMQRVILLLDPDFPNNTSWRFIDSDYDFPFDDNPWYEPFPEVLNYNNLDEVINDADFVAVKIGDVNHSAVTTNLIHNDDRNLGQAYAFNTPAQEFKAGENYQIDIFAPDVALQGCQFTLDFDPEMMSVLELLPGAASTDQIGMSRLEEGAITVSWYTNSATHLKATPLFSLMVRAEKNGTLENNLRINARLIAAEAYTADLKIHPVYLEFTKGQGTSSVYLYQNIPNPFHSETKIGFHLPEAGKASLTVMTVDGKILQTITADYPAGYNEVLFRNLNTTGILYYQLETKDTVVSRKMIKME